MLKALAIPFRPPTATTAPLPQREKTRSALVVGINYSGANLLRGCVNDADDMESLLVKDFGLKKPSLIRLRDKDATRKAITDAIFKLAQTPADYVHICYSGHGSYLADTGADEADGRDETIVPWDYARSGMILDDELWQLWRLFPSTTTLFLHMDSCHSATVSRGFSFTGIMDAASKFWRGERARFLPAETVSAVAAVATRAGMDQTKNRIRVAPIPRQQAGPLPSEPVARIVSLSGCQDWQTSADAKINGRWCGAMTWAFGQAYKALGKTATHKQIHEEMLRLLRTNGYAQIPALLTVNSPDDAALNNTLFT